jgi:hypothetical protein
MSQMNRDKSASFYTAENNDRSLNRGLSSQVTICCDCASSKEASP